MEAGHDVPTWTEDDGTQVWLVVADGRGPVPDLAHVEDLVRRSAEPGAVFGANAYADDQERLAQLTSSGYDRALSMVELHRDASVVPSRGVEVKIRSVNGGDAAEMHRLTTRVWAGRAFFVMPTLHAYREWVRRADPSLMLVALDGWDLVGYIAAEVEPDGLRIDDIQVDPAWQRKGIATRLVRRIAERASKEGCRRLVLDTEGDDPVGARTFYESLGFRVVLERLRYRKTVMR